jgi:alkylation response protein AidB-like acyl-CoA dehydrogenase
MPISPLHWHALPPEAQAWRDEVRAFIAPLLADMPADERARSWVAASPAFSRALAQRGWVGITLPKRYGGAELDALRRYVLVEELLVHGAPVFSHWIADRQSGPLINKFGNEAQRQFYLPRICRGEAFFCIGMSEPQSGSDLASVRSRATKVPGGWRLNGQKVWTSGAHGAHYMIALVRSSGTPEDKQKGLSQFIVDMKAPGVSTRPIIDLAGDHHFNEVFFDDVALDDNALVGDEGAGWLQVNAELAFERSGPERIFSSNALLDAWLQHARAHPNAANTQLAGRLLGQQAVLRGLSMAVVAKLARGESPLTEAALMKDLGTTLEQDIPRLIHDALGADPQAVVSDELLRACTYVLQVCPTFSLRGGTREILRGMIARGLGLR